MSGRGDRRSLVFFVAPPLMGKVLMVDIEVVWFVEGYGWVSEFGRLRLYCCAVVENICKSREVGWCVSMLVFCAPFSFGILCKGFLDLLMMCTSILDSGRTIHYHQNFLSYLGILFVCME